MLDLTGFSTKTKRLRHYTAVVFIILGTDKDPAPFNKHGK